MSPSPSAAIFASFLDSPPNEVSRVSIRLDHRPQPKVVYIPTESDDGEALDEELDGKQNAQNPHEKKHRGDDLQVEVRRVSDGQWIPPPRECATLTADGLYLYMIGGINNALCTEIIRGKIIGNLVQWEKVPYTSIHQISGRQCHSSVNYQGKIYIFGGCFMFNPNR